MTWAGRRRIAGAVAGALALGALALGALAWIALPQGKPTPATPRRASPAASSSLVFAVRASEPFLAVVGGGRNQVALTVPPRLQIELAGQGPGTSEDLAALPGPSLRTDLSNVLGMWIDHYAVTDLPHLGALVGRSGLRIHLDGTVNLPTGAIGPGDVTLSGAELRRYLSIDGPNAFTRWEVVLQGIFATPPAIDAGDLTETDDAPASARALAAAAGADIATFPTKLSVGPLKTPDVDSLDLLMQRDFGVVAPPIPVFVQNGSGAPGVGEAVATALVPAGFRVVISENATRFGRRRTVVIAEGLSHIPDAERARVELGVGTVAVTRVPSGLSEVTVVVGKDFSS